MAKFGMRNEYTPVPMYSYKNPGVIVGYAAICDCALGYHYLAADQQTGALVECTADKGHVVSQAGMVGGGIFQTYVDAQAAIETWQRQHQHESEE